MTCGKCGKKFNLKQNFDNHGKNCSGNYKTTYVNTMKSSKDSIVC